MKSKHVHWIAGMLVSISVGGAMAIQYDGVVGAAVGYVLMLLVDIRYEVAP